MSDSSMFGEMNYVSIWLNMINLYMNDYDQHIPVSDSITSD